MKKLAFVLMVLSLATVVFADCNNMISENNRDNFTNFLIDTPETCGWKKTSFTYSNEYRNIKRIKNPASQFVGGKYIYYDAAAFSDQDKNDTLIEIWISPDEQLLVGFTTMIGNSKPYAYFFKKVDGDTIKGYSDHDKNGIYDYPFALDMKGTEPIPIQAVWEVKQRGLTRGKYSYKKYDSYEEYKKNEGYSK